MASANPRPSGLRNILSIVALRIVQTIYVLALLAGITLLLLTGYVLVQERTWLPAASPPPVGEEAKRKHNEEAFFHGTIGTEIVPLPVLLVLPELAPQHFQPFGKESGSWIEQFGFIPGKYAPPSSNPDPQARELPLGFTVSHYRPKSGAPSPVPFVGVGCATCHTTLINGRLVVGTGNTSLNLFSWIDAFQAALQDENVTDDAILTAYERDKEHRPLSLAEKAMIRVWLEGTRSKQAEDMTRYGAPYGGNKSMQPENVPTGPCRTQPFRTLVRTLLHRPAADMKVYTKIAPIYWQELEDGWGQFDGGIYGLHRRSSAAALAAGATTQNMSLPEIADNIRGASDYVSTLRGPDWTRLFPDKPIDPAKRDAGKEVYLKYCNKCHGHREGAQWVQGELRDKLTLLQEIRTDPERVTFRYFEELPDALATWFPANSPFDFPRDVLRPAARKSPDDPVERGYINKPMTSMFSRAPYLHNASVLTLEELINLADRKPVFYRGANSYDTAAVGLSSPGEKDHDPNDKKLYFRFDTAVPGNSNKGHDYPWTREEVRKDPEKQKALEGLLEYLKTL
jgi:mono/diheme cytochrome c family protein